jgi:hypothetical protein
MTTAFWLASAHLATEPGRDSPCNDAAALTFSLDAPNFRSTPEA